MMVYLISLLVVKDQINHSVEQHNDFKDKVIEKVQQCMD